MKQIWIQINPAPRESRLRQSGLLLISTTNKITRGSVIAVPDEEDELSEGDDIFFAQDMTFQADVSGETVYFIRKASVFCKVVDEELVPINNMVLLTIDTSKVIAESYRSPFLIDDDGQKLKVERFVEAFDAAPKRSIVKAAPKVIKGGNGIDTYIADVKINKGDYVYHHYLACDPRFKIEFNGEVMYWQEINQIFAVERDGDIIPLERYVFIKPTEDDESQLTTKSGIITKSKAGLVPYNGTIKYASPYAQRLGYEIGASVKFHDNAKYENVINGEMLYKTRINNIYWCSSKAAETVFIQ